MRFIDITPNVIINLEQVGAIEKKRDKVIIWVQGMAFTVEDKEKVDKIIQEIASLEKNLWGTQSWAG